MSSTRYVDIDLSGLPAPDIVETIEFEEILSERIQELIVRDPEFSAIVESDPIHKVEEVNAYREIILRQRVNDAARAVLLAKAANNDLDHIAALVDVKRKVLQEADPTKIPPIPKILESDTDLRKRTLLSWERMSTAGASGAYLFWGLSADKKVRDVSVYSPTPGVVRVSVLSTDGKGEADQELLDKVNKVLNDEDIRPLTDKVEIQSAKIIEYQIVAEITIKEGVSSDIVIKEAIKNAQAYTEKKHKLKENISVSGIYSAIHVQSGTVTVKLISPTQDISSKDDSAPYCTKIDIKEAK